MDLVRGAASRTPALASLVLLVIWATAARAEDPQRLVQQAVQTELAANNSDDTKWLFYEVDRTAGHTDKKWVAETSKGSLERVVEENGHATSQQQQRSKMESFIHDGDAQAKQRKDDQHDDKQSADMLNLMARAFDWTETSSQGNDVTLHFKPNPQFNPPTYAARVFAAMEGDMVIEKQHHRIVSLKGRMTHAVKFLGGMLGGIEPGGTFNVERRNTGNGEWQITETHVHIHGRVLMFKSISEQEDNEKTKFRELPENISFQQAESELMKAN